MEVPGSVTLPAVSVGIVISFSSGPWAACGDRAYMRLDEGSFS